MTKVAFYVMNLKGYNTLKSFIEKFGVGSVAYIVSSNDKAVKKDYFEEIRELAIKSEIKLFDRFKDFSDLDKNPNVYKFAIGWRWLIKNEKNLIVFHDSLIPKYRGFAPLVNSLINKELNVGVTALVASGNYDQGDIIAQKKIEIKYPIKINEAIERILPLYFYLVDKIYKKIIGPRKNKEIDIFEVKRQNEKEATYSLWLDNEDYFIDWSWSAEKIKRFVDAVGYPYDVAKAYLDRKIVNFVDVDVVTDVIIENRDRHLGKVIFIKNEFPIVVCQRGLIRLVDVRDNENNIINVKFRSRFY